MRSNEVSELPWRRRRPRSLSTEFFYRVSLRPRRFVGFKFSIGLDLISSALKSIGSGRFWALEASEFCFHFFQKLTLMTGTQIHVTSLRPTGSMRRYGFVSLILLSFFSVLSLLIELPCFYLVFPSCSWNDQFYLVSPSFFAEIIDDYTNHSTEHRFTEFYRVFVTLFESKKHCYLVLPSFYLILPSLNRFLPSFSCGFSCLPNFT